VLTACSHTHKTSATLVGDIFPNRCSDCSTNHFCSDWSTNHRKRYRGQPRPSAYSTRPLGVFWLLVADKIFFNIWRRQISLVWTVGNESKSVKVAHLYSAHETSLISALRYSTHCQGITQFYIHTLRFIRKRNEPYLPLPFQPLQLVLIYRPRRDGRLSGPWCEVAPAEIRTCNLPIANIRHSASSESVSPPAGTVTPLATAAG